MQVSGLGGLRLLAVVMFFVLIGSGTGYAGKTEDWKKLSDFQGGFTPFQSEYSASDHDGKFVKEWKEWREGFEPFAKQFLEQYGSDVQALQKSFANLDLPEGVHNFPHHMLDLLTVDFDKKQKEIGGWLKKEGDKNYKKWKGNGKTAKEKLELKADYADRARQDFMLANELTPRIADKALANAEQAYQSTMKEWEGALKELTWPGNNPNFEGPGKPEQLALEAISLLNKMAAEGRHWSKPEYDDEHTPVAACVTGSGWEVSKTAPITKAPLQYTVKMFVLFKGKKSDEIGYGYYMQFYTKEAGGVKKEPPFVFCNSRLYEKHKMLLSEAPSGSGGSGSTGFLGMVVRLCLSLTLIAGGLMAAGQVFAGKIPALASVVEILTGKSKLVAGTLFIAGAVSLLFSLLSLSPLGNLLPQVCAIALALALFTTAGVPDAGNEKVDETIQKAAEKLSPAGKILAPYLVWLGQGGLALGLIHLVIGGAVLF